MWCVNSLYNIKSSLFLWWYSSMLWWTLYDAQFSMHSDLMIHALIMMTWCMLWCDHILLCTMMCTFYMHITCWWWWWLFDDDDSTYPMTLMYNLWWCSTIAKQRYFSDCGWQWAVCGSDIYRDDLTVIRVQRLSAADSKFGMWQVHRFGNLFLICVAGRGKERRP